MTYVIGTSENRFLKISPCVCVYNKSGRLEEKMVSASITTDGPNSKAAFFDNESEAFEMIEKFKKMGDNLKIQNFFEEDAFSLDDLKVYSLIVCEISK